MTIPTEIAATCSMIGLAESAPDFMSRSIASWRATQEPVIDAVLVPPSARTEGFSWLGSGLALGVAVGFAASGAVADAAGARTAFLVALGAAVAAAAVVLAGRRQLAAAPQSSTGVIQAR